MAWNCLKVWVPGFMAAIPYLRLWDNHSAGLKCCQGINAQEEYWLVLKITVVGFDFQRLAPLQICGDDRVSIAVCRIQL
jgi:hypothetical protein